MSSKLKYVVSVVSVSIMASGMLHYHRECVGSDATRVSDPMEAAGDSTCGRVLIQIRRANPRGLKAHHLLKMPARRYLTFEARGIRKGASSFTRSHDLIHITTYHIFTARFERDVLPVEEDKWASYEEIKNLPGCEWYTRQQHAKWWSKALRDEVARRNRRSSYCSGHSLDAGLKIS